MVDMDADAFAVAPHAGAWIETLIQLDAVGLRQSPLTQGRGLKPAKKNVVGDIRGRPSRRGVD